MKLEHIGYLVKNIEKTAQAFESLGYQQGDIYNDDIQKTKYVF